MFNISRLLKGAKEFLLRKNPPVPSDPPPSSQTLKPPSPLALDRSQGHELEGISPAALALIQGALAASEELFTRRVMLAFDATMSRGRTFRAAIEMLGSLADQLARAGEVPAELRVSFFSGTHSYKATKWTSNVEYTKNIVRSVTCEAGTTQIHRVLEDVLNQTEKKKLRSVIYVGDHVDGDRDIERGTLVHLAREIGLSIPIHIMHEVQNPDRLDECEAHAASIFKQIAAETGGQYETFQAGRYEDAEDKIAVLVASAYGPESKAMLALRNDNSLTQGAQRLLQKLGR